jgi:hypothetical protein
MPPFLNGGITIINSKKFARNVNLCLPGFPERLNAILI